MSDGTSELYPGRPTSFAELQAREDMDANEVIGCAYDYAHGGASIVGHVVTGLLDRTTPSEAQLRDLAHIARVGMDKQDGRPIEQAHYARVLEHVGLLLEQRGE